MKRQFKPMWKALKEARAYDDRLTEKDGNLRLLRG